MRRTTMTGVVILPALLAAIASADAPLRLNEIRVEQPGAETDEYIELSGAAGESLTGVSIIVIGDDNFAPPGSQNGVIEAVINLDGFTVGASGIFLVGEPTLSLALPNFATSLNLEGNDNLTVLLVRGFSGTDGQKLDNNDDGVLDVLPWSSIVSSLAIVSNNAPNGLKSDWYYSTTTIGPDGGLQPAAAWLCANTSQWNLGSQDPFVGVDTPGAVNLTCVPTGVIINEARIDMTGNDNDEYFELKGTPGTTIGDLTYIVIGDNGATSPSGAIEAIVSLTGQVIGANGLFVAAEATMTLGVPSLIVPGANGINFENQDNVTHMLVRGFTGVNLQDLDTNDDGVFDVTPWTEIVDSVAFVLSSMPPPTGVEWVYSASRVGPDGTFVPGHIYRCTPSGSWSIGPFAPVGGSDTINNPNAACTTCGPGGGNCHAVHVTPGCVDAICCNSVCAIDPTCCNEGWDQACVDQARLSCLVAGSAPVITLNEIRNDDPGTLDPSEYVEIKGTPGTNLNGVSLVFIGDGADLDGVIDGVVSLNGLFIPKDGILLIAEASFTLATADAIRVLNLENGSSTTYMLVFNFTGLNYADYDTNNDCTIDAPQWDSIIDSVGGQAGDNRCVYSANVVGPDYFGMPAHLVRCADGSWGFGHFDPADPTGFDTPGVANTVCPPANACGDAKSPSCYTAHATPGCSEGECCSSICLADLTCCDLAWDQGCADMATLLCFVPGTAPEVALSEIRIDQISFDVDEYFELRGEPGTLLNGLSYIVIGDAGATQGSGVVEYAINLQGQTIPASGFFLAAKSTFTLNGAVPNMVVPASPEMENSDNVTHMLVFGFTGAIGADLDTNDDGIFDSTPWTTVVQTVAFIEDPAVTPAATELAYGDVRVGPAVDGFVPSQLAYCPTTQVWTIGFFDPALNPGFDTPGAANVGCDYTETTPCPADLDGNGAVDAADLAGLLSGWGGAGASDLDQNGSTDAADLAVLLGAWGTCL